VVHRDNKPANVMVWKYGEVYVMDWGLAEVIGMEDRHDLRLSPRATSPVRSSRGRQATDSPLITMDRSVVGTPCYMPLEQAEGRALQAWWRLTHTPGERVPVAVLREGQRVELELEVPRNPGGSSMRAILARQ
jgi:serine/threonine protein kinase